MCSYWPEVNTVISKRSKKLVDYDAARSKARKLADKPSDDVSKLPRAEAESEQAREIYEALDSNLKNELPVLLDLVRPMPAQSIAGLLTRRPCAAHPLPRPQLRGNGKHHSSLS